LQREYSLLWGKEQKLAPRRGRAGGNPTQREKGKDERICIFSRIKSTLFLSHRREEGKKKKKRRPGWGEED